MILGSECQCSNLWLYRDRRPIPVQQWQGMQGPALADTATVEKTLEVLLLLQVLADKPPNLLWNISKNHVDDGRACACEAVPTYKGT